MKVATLPARAEWPSLLERPTFPASDVAANTAAIINDIRARGDRALIEVTAKYDGAWLENLRVSEAEFAEAGSLVPDDLKRAIARAAENIRKFHKLVPVERNVVETSTGVFCWKKDVAIDHVGLYVPAGSAPLFSTVLMLAIPAVEAGCRRIVITTPPGPNGEIHPAVLYTADICGIHEVYKVGGAQAIAALALGTETVPRVDKIFGPGNQYVTEAKLQVLRYGVAIDMPAGPSEVAVLADETCIPEFVAADLLAQAEHGADSHVLLVSPSAKVIDDVLMLLPGQLKELPRAALASAALEHSVAVQVEDLDVGIELINEYGPEHLIIATVDAETVAERIRNAGSVFIGNLACESAGDYASGTNHTLPTGGSARAYSGLSSASFMKTITFQRISSEGLADLGPVIETMAAGEHLDAHKNAVTVRLDRERAADG